MSAVSDPVLGEVVRRLVEAYNPERIYLFGSVARGESGPDSDCDIMVCPAGTIALGRKIQFWPHRSAEYAD